MTWTRLDDAWSEQTVLEDLSFEDRWHYLTIIQRCNRTDSYDGLIRSTDARRCSDHPDPAAANARLVDAGLLEIVPGGKYRVVNIDDHTPPPWVRKKTERDRTDKRRKRAHDSGDHSLCRPDAPCVDTTVVTTVVSDSRTGQDRPGRDVVKNTNREAKKPALKLVPPTSTWPVVSVPAGPVCDVCLMPMPKDAVLTICETEDEAHEEARIRTAS